MSMFPTRISLFSGAVALSLLASTATATPISLVYDGPSVTNSDDRETVTITTSPVTVATENSVYANGFNMTDTSGTIGSFLAWCLDVSSFLSNSGSTAEAYIITDDPFSNSYGLSDTEQARVQSVFDANFGTLDATNGVEAAGFQVALWNALYEGDLFAEAGAFAVSASQAVIDKANYFLGTAANDNPNENLYQMSFLESAPGDDQTRRQNLVTVSPVPLPAAGMLLLVALGGLGFAGRRRKAT